MGNLSFTDPNQLAKAARSEILRMTSAAGASHVASALSVVDILASIYSGNANIDIENLNNSERDIVILSKGHAASALYSVLALKGFFPRSWLEKYCSNDAPLGGHVTSKGVPGVELSTGSLGHGLPYGLGIALSRKMDSTKGKVIVIMSDGECDEGTTWESAMIANHHNLDNLVVFVDRNRIQSLAGTEETLKLEPFGEKWKAFGWEVLEIDGHCFDDLEKSLDNLIRPRCVIANTTKGHGVDFMENSVLWHYKSPNETELALALERIEDL